MSTPVHRFRIAMVKHLGKVITPEVAAAIECEAFHEPDRSIDPARFAAVTHGDYTIGVESLRAILEELAPLHEQHWQETEKHRHGIALRPNYDAMMARERAGRLLQFTVRRGQELAGHLRIYLGESLHTGTLMAEEDTLYLKPEHRGGMTASYLLAYAEDILFWDIGVLEIRANSKRVNNAGVLMRRRRYEHVADQFVKMRPADPPTERLAKRAACAVT